MARCASCHAEVPSTQRFCGRCGTPVTPASQTGTVALTGGAAARLYPANAPEEGRFPPGAVLAQRYRIGGRLGKGGMGEVYRAFDLCSGRTSP